MIAAQPDRAGKMESSLLDSHLVENRKQQDKNTCGVPDGGQAFSEKNPSKIIQFILDRRAVVRYINYRSYI